MCGDQWSYLMLISSCVYMVQYISLLFSTIWIVLYNGSERERERIVFTTFLDVFTKSWIKGLSKDPMASMVRPRQDLAWISEAWVQRSVTLHSFSHTHLSSPCSCSLRLIWLPTESSIVVAESLGIATQLNLIAFPLWIWLTRVGILIWCYEVWSGKSLFWA